MKARILLVLFALTFSFSGCMFWGVRGSGDIEKEDREVEEFSAIEASGAFKIEVLVGEGQSLTVVGDDNLLKYVVTKVRGHKLVIDSKRNLKPRKDIVIKIRVKKLDFIESSGASELYVEGLNNDRLQVRGSGASDLKLIGSVNMFTLDLSGAGSVRARDLIAKHVKVEISGASDADVYASESIDAEISGVGTVNYYGDPEKVISDVSGVGSIKRK